MASLLVVFSRIIVLRDFNLLFQEFNQGGCSWPPWQVWIWPKSSGVWSQWCSEIKRYCHNFVMDWLISDHPGVFQCCSLTQGGRIYFTDIVMVLGGPCWISKSAIRAILKVWCTVQLMPSCSLEWEESWTKSSLFNILVAIFKSLQSTGLGYFRDSVCICLYLSYFGEDTVMECEIVSEDARGCIWGAAHVWRWFEALVRACLKRVSQAARGIVWVRQGAWMCEVDEWLYSPSAEKPGRIYGWGS